jgi:hypothetical protein
MTVLALDTKKVIILTDLKKVMVMVMVAETAP